MARKSRKLTGAENVAAVNIPVTVAAWVYSRISKDSDHAEDSIENQIAICKDYIDADSGMTLGGVFTDLGYSGTNFERPGYADMMAGILCGDVGCVVVKDLSRLGRAYIEVGELLFDTFVQYGVRFISVNDHYDSFADDADRKKLMILFKNLINHMYSKDLGRKIKSAHDAKKQRGELAGQPSYGYMRGEDGKQLAIDGDAAEVVRMIFDMRLASHSANSIAKHLNQNEVPSPQRRRYLLGQIAHEKFSASILWGAEIVCRILKNETYTGVLVQGKYACNGKRHRLLPQDQWIRHENKHPAIISREQFDAVQKLMDVATGQYRKIGNITPENAYAGKTFCSRCGEHIQRVDGGGRGRTLYYYICRHCADELKQERGIKRAVSLPLVKLDALVTETLRFYMDELVQFDNLGEILKKSGPLRQKSAQLRREKVRLEKTVGDFERNLSAAYTHHLEGLLDLREYELVRAKIERDKRDAEARLAQVCAEWKKYDIHNVLDNQWLNKYRAFRNFETPSKELIQTLINRIYLTPLTNEVSIELNFMDCLRELRQLLQESGVKAGE